MHSRPMSRASPSVAITRGSSSEPRRRPMSRRSRIAVESAKPGAEASLSNAQVARRTPAHEVEHRRVGREVEVALEDQNGSVVRSYQAESETILHVVPDWCQRTFRCL